MAGRVAAVRAEQAPGLAVVADAAGVPVACALDALVGDPQGRPLTAPVHLPVEGPARQRLLAQHLGQAVEAGGAVPVGLGVPLQGCLPVVPGQVQLPIGRVGVQSELAGDWKTERTFTHECAAAAHCKVSFSEQTPDKSLVRIADHKHSL